jgi:pimeloyl-ACP methyl ester carboxylesterase
MHPTALAARRAYVDTPNGQVHFYDTGGEGRPLVLLHQSPTSSVDFSGVFPILKAAGLRLIAIDGPGMGLSDPPPRPTTVDDFVDAVFGVLDHLKVRQADVLGHHTGALVAVEAAVREPERYRKVVLYGAPLLSLETSRAYWNEIVPREREGVMHKPVPGGQNLIDRFARLESLFGHKTAQHMLVSNLLAGPTMWYAHNAALTFDMAPSFERLTQPLLLITHKGEMLDEATRLGKTLKPDAKLVELDLDGGVAMDMAPEAFAGAVIKFLAN